MNKNKTITRLFCELDMRSTDDVKQVVEDAVNAIFEDMRESGVVSEKFVARWEEAPQHAILNPDGRLGRFVVTAKE